jgi:hypothetical protein
LNASDIAIDREHVQHVLAPRPKLGAAGEAIDANRVFAWITLSLDFLFGDAV